MKRTLFSSLAVVLSVFGFSAMAQTAQSQKASSGCQQQCVTPCSKQQCAPQCNQPCATDCAQPQCDTTCAAGQCAPQCRPCFTPGQQMKKHAKAYKTGQPRDIFAGLTLTAEQRAQLDSLQSKRSISNIRINRPERDTTLTPEQRQEKWAKAVEAARAQQLSFLREVANIIGPDQYVVFLENMVVNQPQKALGQRHAKKMKAQGQKSGKDSKGKDLKATAKGSKSQGKARASRKFNTQQRPVNAM